MLTSTCIISKPNGALLEKTIIKQIVFMHIIGKTLGVSLNFLTIITQNVKTGSLQDISLNTLKAEETWKTVCSLMDGKKSITTLCLIKFTLAKRRNV